MKILVLAQNFEMFDEGNYHQDLINAICNLGEVFLYGPGYKGYNKKDTFFEVIQKSGWDLENIDYIIAATSWDKYVQYEGQNPHPSIELNKINSITKIYFLQNEYKCIEQKLSYAAEQKFNYVISIYKKGLYDDWSKKTGINVIYSGHGIDLSKFNDKHLNRTYDFMFTGSLHEKFLPERKLVKEELFCKTKLFCKYDIFSNKGIYRILSIVNPIRKEYRKYNIYWAERHLLTRSLLGKKLVPFGEDYVQLLNQSKVSLCTYSANRLIGPRFYELMKTGTLIFCPEDDYGNLLIDGYNCVMFKKDMTDFKEKLDRSINDSEYRNRIVTNAKGYAENQDYDHRLKEIFTIINAEKQNKPTFTAL